MLHNKMRNAARTMTKEHAVTIVETSMIPFRLHMLLKNYCQKIYGPTIHEFGAWIGPVTCSVCVNQTEEL